MNYFVTLSAVESSAPLEQMAEFQRAVIFADDLWNLAYDALDRLGQVH